jgi:hypothetical protein
MLCNATRTLLEQEGIHVAPGNFVVWAKVIQYPGLGPTQPLFQFVPEGWGKGGL